MKRKFLIYTTIFLSAFLFHLIGLNHIGRGEDEAYKINYGYVAWQWLLSGDFSYKTWSSGIQFDHPMVAKYIYGLFESSDVHSVQDEESYLKSLSVINPQGFQSELQTRRTQNIMIENLWNKDYYVPYDYTSPRIASALCNAFTVLLTVIIANYLVGNMMWCTLAGVFLLLTPRFVFLGQLATFESISNFLFCSIFIYFYKLLHNPKKTKLYIFVGLLCGLYLWTRFNNVIFLPFLAGWLGIHYLYTKQTKIFTWKLLIIPIIAFAFGVLIWPFLWYDIPGGLMKSSHQHTYQLVGISFYYWKYFLVTTPIPILLGFFIGLYFCIRKRTYIQTVILWWVLCEIIIYSILVITMGGTRYASLLYPVMMILSAYGYYSILKRKAVYLLIPIIAYLIFEQVKIFPYYPDYYNEFVGGTSGAIQKGYDFSWWGEGQREAGLWINNNVPDGSSVGLIVNLEYLFPSTRGTLHLKGFVDEKSDADYIVVDRNSYAKLSQDFLKKHAVAYQVLADNEPLIYVLKKVELKVL